MVKGNKKKIGREKQKVRSAKERTGRQGEVTGVGRKEKNCKGKETDKMKRRQEYRKMEATGITMEMREGERQGGERKEAKK